MTLKTKILSLVATICALPAGLLHAQAFGAAYAVKFTTSFPFYVFRSEGAIREELHNQ